MRYVIPFLVVCSLATPSQAQESTATVTAEDVQITPPIQTIPPGKDKIVPLGPGDDVPFAGQLFEPATAMRWAFWLQQWKGRYKLDIAHERNLCLARTTYQDTVLEVEKSRATAVEKDLKDRLLRTEQARSDAEYKLNNPGFFQSKGFYYALGVLSTGAILGLGVWATSD